jgi:hypothetical protein
MMCNNFGRSRLNRGNGLQKQRSPSTPRRHRQLLGIMAAILVLGVSLLAFGNRLNSQTCTSDEQCQQGQRPNAECVGDILVVKRYVCLGGACRDIEERRENCGAAEASRCRAGAFEQTSRRCDAVRGRCEQHIERELCLESCDCRDNTLYVSSGQCSSTLGCTRVSMKCEHGCTCSPEPKCAEAPAK